jgi:hypothetical protein
MSAHSKDDLAAAERYACIGRLRWEAEQKKDKSSPKSDLRRSGSLRAKAGKADSTIAAAAATATTTTVVVGGKQTKKNSMRQRQVSELCELMVKLARGRTGEAGFRDSRFAGRTRERLDLAIADSTGGVQAK